MDDAVSAALLTFAGGFALVGAATGADWFLQNRQARVFVRVLGRTGARVFYGAVGLLLVSVAVGLLVW
jgi:small neutral amino acid transporter SnatA (MarC family)